MIFKSKFESKSDFESLNMKAQKPLCIFEYFDYREFLLDLFAYLKKGRHGYSYRTFAREAGISSHNFLPRIIHHERNLSADFVPLLTRYLKFSIKEQKYFATLIAFNNAKNPFDKEHYLKQLLTLRVVNAGYRLQDAKLRFFEKWYYPVVRELAALFDFKDDYALLARRCIPRITPVQAKKAVAFLIDNGFLQKGKDGRYSVTEPLMATDPEVNSAIIPAYHRVTLQQCVDAVETIRKEDRNFSSLTLRVSQELCEQMKQEIYHFRKRLLAMAGECRDPDMVCFVGFQLLPRSETNGRAEEDKVAEDA